MEKFSKVIQDLPDGSNVIRCYTDGGCWWKTRIGAWAYIIEDKFGVTLDKKTAAVTDTTTGRMELTAIIEALRSLDSPYIVEIVGDSQYALKGLSLWMFAWERTNWKVANADLWKILFELNKRHQIYTSWIRGHSGVPGNELVDRMCTNSMKEFKNVNSFQAENPSELFN